MDITQNYPNAPEAAGAWYRLGRHDMELRDFRAAVEKFEKVVQRFPNDPVSLDARINLGSSLVYLRKFDEAEPILTKALLRARTPEQESMILYHLGESEYLQGRFLPALRRFVECRNVEGTFRLQSERRIRRILKTSLSEKELIAVTTEYDRSFPAEAAFEELLKLYERKGDMRSLAKTREIASRLFPGIAVPETAAEKAPEHGVTIGALLPLSGDDALKGSEALRGIQLAFSMNSGIVAEKGIRLAIKDTEGKADPSAQAAYEMGADRSVIAAIGPFSDESLDAAIETAWDYGLPLLSPAEASLAHEPATEMLFPIGLTGDSEGKILGELAVENLGDFRVAVLYPENSYGLKLLTSFSKTVRSLGGEIVAEESYDPAATDYSAQIKKLGGMSDSTIRNIIMKMVDKDKDKYWLEDEHEYDFEYLGKTPEEINAVLELRYQRELAMPYISRYGTIPLEKDNFSIGLRLNYDAVFIPGDYKSAGMILPELDFYNISGAQVIGSDLYASRELVAIAGRHAGGVLFPAEFLPELQRFAVQNFITNYHNAFGGKPGLEAARAYDAVNILISLIRDGADTRTMIINSLNNLEPYTGVSGEFQAGSSNRMEKTPFLITLKNGRFVEFNP